MSLKNVDFSKLDYSIIRDDLKEINREVLELKKNKRYMKKFRKFQEEKNCKLTYNNLETIKQKNSKFTKTSSETLILKKQSSEAASYDLDKYSIMVGGLNG